MKKLIQQKCAKLEQESATLIAKKAASVTKPLFLKQASEDMEKYELSIARKKLSIVSSKLSLDSSVDVLENETFKVVESARSYTRVMLSPEPDHKQTAMDADKPPSECNDEVKSSFFHESGVILINDDVNNICKHSDTVTITICDSDDEFEKDESNSNKESENTVKSTSSSSKGKENEKILNDSNEDQCVPILESETSKKDPPSTGEDTRIKKTDNLEKTTPNINITILEELLKDFMENKDVPTFNHPLHEPRASKVKSYEQLMKKRSSVNIENNSFDIRSHETLLQTSNIPTECSSKNATMGLNNQTDCAPPADYCIKRENLEINDTASTPNFQTNTHESANTKPAENYRISERDSGHFTNTHLRYNKQEITYNNSPHPRQNAVNGHVLNRNIFNSDYSCKSRRTCHERTDTPGKWNYTTNSFAPVNTQPCFRSCYHGYHNTMTGDNNIQSDQPMTPIPELSPSGNLMIPNHSFSQYSSSTQNTPKFREATVADTFGTTLDRMIAIFQSHERADRINYDVRSNNLQKFYNEYRPVPLTRRERSADRSRRSRYHRFEHAGMENHHHRSAFGTMRFGLPEHRVRRARSRPPDDRINWGPRHKDPFEDRRRRAASMDRNLIYINRKDSIMNHRLEGTLTSSQLPKNKNMEKGIQVLLESFTENNNETKEEEEKKSLKTQPENKEMYELKRHQNLNKEKDNFHHGLIESPCKSTKVEETTGKISKHKQPPASAVLSENKLHKMKSEIEKIEKIKPKEIKNNTSQINKKGLSKSFVESNKKPKEEQTKMTLNSQPRKKLNKKVNESESKQNPTKDILDKYKHEILVSPEKTTIVKTTRKKTTFQILKQLVSSKKGIAGNCLKKSKPNEGKNNKIKGSVFKKSKTRVLTKKVTETKTENKKKKIWPALSRDERTKQKTNPKVTKTKKRVIYSDSDSDDTQTNQNNVTEPSKRKNVTTINEELLNSPDSDEETTLIKVKKSKIRRIVYSDSDSEILQETVKVSKNTSSDRGVALKITDINSKINKSTNDLSIDFIKNSNDSSKSRSKVKAAIESEADNDEKNNCEIISSSINTEGKTKDETVMVNNNDAMFDVVGNMYKRTSATSEEQSNDEYLENTVKISSYTATSSKKNNIGRKNTAKARTSATSEQQLHYKSLASLEHTVKISSDAATSTKENTIGSKNTAKARTSATSEQQSNDKSLASLEHTVKISPDTSTSTNCKKNDKGKKDTENKKNKEPRNNTDDEDSCITGITTQMKQNELNKSALSLTNNSDVLEKAIPNSIQEEMQNQSFKEPLSVARTLLQDIPNSILISFMYDLCHQREKEEIAEIIKRLNNIVSDDNDNVKRGIKVKAKRKRGRPPKRKPSNSEIGTGVSNSENKKSLIVKDKKPGWASDGSSYLSITETNQNQLESKIESENNGEFIIELSSDSDDDSPETGNAEIQKNYIICNSKELNVTGMENNFDSHFKICKIDSGAKEYICCISGNKNHFKSKLKVQMKKHVVAEHSEIWDGYCSFCKKNITLNRPFTFVNCFEHMFSYHLDDFPALDQKMENISEDVSNAKLDVTCQINKTTDAVRVDGVEANGLIPNISLNIPSHHDKEQNISNPVTATTDNKNTAITEPKGVNTIDKEDPILTAEASCSHRPKTSEIEMIYKYEEHQTNIMNSKHSSILSTMLSEEKLMHTYKCAGRYCSYSTNSLDLAKEHITAHTKARLKNENVLICAYCDLDWKNNIDDLVKHVFETHGRCRYTCSQCFYRAAASQLVVAHMQRMHPESLKKILEAPSSDCRNKEECLPQHIKIQRYYCNNKTLTPECKRSYFSQGSFIRHLQNHDAPFLCYICNHASNEPEKLLQHMSDHGLKKYHCTWCSEGGDSEEEFMAHFSARHPTREPQAYLRKVNGMQEDKSRIIVLPLVELNKSMVTTHLVTPSTENNPVIEAHKAHNLEELIESVSKEVQIAGVRNSLKIRSKLSAVAIAKLPNDTLRSVEEEENITTKDAKENNQTTSEDNSIKQVSKRKLPKCEGSQNIHKRVRSSEQDLPTKIDFLNSDEKAQCERNTENSTALPILLQAEKQYPKYVPERRYTCGAKDCTFSFDVEDHLLSHWKVYHPNENEFYCVHCKISVNFVSLNELTKHFNLHGSTLYACSLCTNVHYQYRYIKRHIDEVHEGVGEVKTVRKEHSPVKEDHLLKEYSTLKDEKLQVNAIHESGVPVNSNKSYRVEEISPICIRLTATAEKTKVPEKAKNITFI